MEEIQNTLTKLIFNVNNNEKNNSLVIAFGIGKNDKLYFGVKGAYHDNLEIERLVQGIYNRNAYGGSCAERSLAANAGSNMDNQNIYVFQHKDGSFVPEASCNSCTENARLSGSKVNNFNKNDMLKFNLEIYNKLLSMPDSISKDYWEKYYEATTDKNQHNYEKLIELRSTLNKKFPQGSTLLDDYLTDLIINAELKGVEVNNFYKRYIQHHTSIKNLEILKEQIHPELTREECDEMINEYVNNTKEEYLRIIENDKNIDNQTAEKENSWIINQEKRLHNQIKNIKTTNVSENFIKIIEDVKKTEYTCLQKLQQEVMQIMGE